MQLTRGTSELSFFRDRHKVAELSPFKLHCCHRSRFRRRGTTSAGGAWSSAARLEGSEMRLRRPHDPAPRGPSPRQGPVQHRARCKSPSRYALSGSNGKAARDHESYGPDRGATPRVYCDKQTEYDGWKSVFDFCASRAQNDEYVA